MDFSNSIEVQFAEMLDDALGRLAGGELSIGAFSDEVMNSEWEAAIAANSSALHLLWDIRNHLHEYFDYPDSISEDEVIRDIRTEVERFSLGIRDGLPLGIANVERR